MSRDAMAKTQRGFWLYKYLRGEDYGVRMKERGRWRPFLVNGNFALIGEIENKLSVQFCGSKLNSDAPVSWRTPQIKQEITCTYGKPR
jgi:hypothetical protein